MKQPNNENQLEFDYCYFSTNTEIFHSVFFDPENFTDDAGVRVHPVIRRGVNYCL